MLTDWLNINVSSLCYIPETHIVCQLQRKKNKLKKNKKAKTVKDICLHKRYLSLLSKVIKA